MNIMAMVIGLFLAAIGLTGVVAPTDLGTIAQNASTPTSVYITSIVRLAVGIVFLKAARGARFPNVLRAFGIFAILVAIAAPLIGVGRDEALVNWWVDQGTQVINLTGAALMIVGGFLAYSAIP
jgi:hypothetical protein